jgi:hypothetical protein
MKKGALKQLIMRPATPENASNCPEGADNVPQSSGLFNSMPQEISEAALLDHITTLSGIDRGLYVVTEQKEDLVSHLLIDPLTLVRNSQVFTALCFLAPETAHNIISH